MQINLENLIPITEANQNFSKVARMVQVEQTEAVVADQASVDEVASSILSRHLEALKELAK